MQENPGSKFIDYSRVGQTEWSIVDATPLRRDSAHVANNSIRLARELVEQ